LSQSANYTACSYNDLSRLAIANGRLGLPIHQ